MIRISQIKLSPACADTAALQKKAAKLLHISVPEILSLSVFKRSLDARKKPEIFAVYTVDVKVADEKKVLERLKKSRGDGGGQIQSVEEVPYRFPKTAAKPSAGRPVIVGSGPAGLFCGYMLAKEGYRPLILERGREIHKRQEDVARFWREGVLDPDSNVQFGEGGAGAFSDGKLTTTVKDPHGRMRAVLRIFVEAGAPEEILYEAKPHIGTDVLVEVTANLRKKILDWGGEVRFASQVTSLLLQDGRVRGVEVSGERIESEAVILAVGHSARDTFRMLDSLHVPMEAKAFAVGLRMEHPREMIDRLQYGKHDFSLPAANYKVTARASGGRGVYSFCMCPGGYVVNASSEPGKTAVNGMSYSARDGKNSNSAMIVTVSPEDYGGTGPLAGIAFQRMLEKRAYEIGQGAVPVERYGDFYEAVRAGQSGKLPVSDVIRREYPGFSPAIKGAWRYAPVHEILPDYLNLALAEGICAIGKKMPGFSDEEAFLSGVESRTSSPVRILRDQTGQSAVRGLYPCGEGAGYAGGITSAAMDGILIAEKVASVYGSVVI